MSYSQILKNFLPMDLAQMRPAGFLERMERGGREKQQKIMEKHGWEPVRQCPVCDSSLSTVELRKFDTEILNCGDCSTRYAARRPVVTEDIYSDDSYIPVMMENYLQNAAYRKARFGPERIALIQKYLRPGGRPALLDVGCGVGWFLEVAREQGFEIFGQEAGRGLARWTGDRLGREIYTQPLAELAQIQRFDVITLFDVLEHVPFPALFVQDVKACLKPGGIAVFFTPNFDSLAIRVMAERSNLIIPAEHLTYFTKKSVETLAAKTQLEWVVYETCGIDLGDLKSFYESQNQQPLAEACAGLYNYLQPVIDAAEAGNHMRFVFRRKE
ncbi:MAG: methyltransferase domain-containing protein [Candidatus Omnitrophica bacterium]|nr:methyltransferase domain-containing protein [Candidatus Omnitrophota bacterium]